MILIDGVPVFSVDAVMAFDPLKIKRLEVLSREYYEGLPSMPGMMSFFTYTGDLGGFPTGRTWCVDELRWRSVATRILFASLRQHE